MRLADGRELPADFVLVAVGVVPTDALARDAGLECDNGIVVDEYCRTSDPHIWAAGDCARHPSIHYGTRVRLESVDNAFEQGTSAALNMLGLTTVHDKVPWFWSDQFDLKMVIVGLAAGHDQLVVRGDPASRAFSVCYLKARRADRGRDGESHQGPDGGAQADPGARAAGSGEARQRRDRAQGLLALLFLAEPAPVV